MERAGEISIDDRAHVPASAFEHAGFRRWATSGQVPLGIRVGFVAGEVLVEMGPESIERHNKPKSEITAALVRFVNETDCGEAYSDGTLITHVAAAISAEPDFVFVSWASFEIGRVTLTKKADRDDEYVELVGSPDLVVEIVSNSSVRKDTKLLRRGYARAAIPEYWLIDARGSTISFQILRLDAGRYQPAAPDGEPQPSAVLGRRFVLSREKNRADRWRYRLDVLPVT